MKNRPHTSSSMGTSKAERFVIMLAVALVIGLFLYVIWGSVTAGGSRPYVNASTVQQIQNNTIVEVKVVNPQRKGLNSVTVIIECRNPPVQMDFSYIPVDGMKDGRVVCPSNTTEPKAEILSWTEI